MLSLLFINVIISMWTLIFYIIWLWKVTTYSIMLLYFYGHCSRLYRRSFHSLFKMPWTSSELSIFTLITLYCITAIGSMILLSWCQKLFLQNTSFSMYACENVTTRYIEANSFSQIMAHAFLYKSIFGI